MRYISEVDNKVFNTEQECLEHEYFERKRLEEENIRKEKFELERRTRLETINKKYGELQELVSEYEKDFHIRQRPYFAPVYELINMLCG